MCGTQPSTACSASTPERAKRVRNRRMRARPRALRRCRHCHRRRECATDRGRRRRCDRSTGRNEGNARSRTWAIHEMHTPALQHVSRPLMPPRSFTALAVASLPLRRFPDGLFALAQPRVRLDERRRVALAQRDVEFAERAEERRLLRLVQRLAAGPTTRRASLSSRLKSFAPKRVSIAPSRASPAITDARRTSPSAVVCVVAVQIVTVFHCLLPRLARDVPRPDSMRGAACAPVLRGAIIRRQYDSHICTYRAQRPRSFRCVRALRSRFGPRPMAH